MLVLSRQAGERVVVGNRALIVEVIEIRGDKVRLGFTADAATPIHREEVFEAIQRETKSGGDAA
jgi:carbon storage regulator